MKKRIIIFTLVLIMCLSLLPMAAIGSTVTEVTDIKNVGDTITIGSFYGKPIVWQVLAIDAIAGKALLIPTELIGFWAFNSENKNTLWEDSSIRKWLNSEFLGSVFTESQRSIILETEIENKAFPETNLTGGSSSNTKDKIFLLSYGEAALYFPSNSARAAVYKATEAQYSALAQAIAAKSINEDWSHKLTYSEAFLNLRDYVGYTDWWWLRTTGTYSYTGSARVACVNYDGSLEWHALKFV